MPSLLIWLSPWASNGIPGCFPSRYQQATARVQHKLAAIQQQASSRFQQCSWGTVTPPKGEGCHHGESQHSPWHHYFSQCPTCRRQGWCLTTMNNSYCQRILPSSEDIYAIFFLTSEAFSLKWNKSSYSGRDKRAGVPLSYLQSAATTLLFYFLTRLTNTKILMNLQANLQEKAQQHKDTVEDSSRLRLEIQRLSDDRDQLATQVQLPFPTFQYTSPSNGSEGFWWIRV